MLYQTDSDDEIERFIAFESKTFTSAESNYVTHERELLAIKKDLRK